MVHAEAVAVRRLCAAPHWLAGVLAWCAIRSCSTAGSLDRPTITKIPRPYDATIWWERRRIPYNAVLLLIGACSFGVIEGIGSQLVQPGEDVVEPLVLLFGGVVFVVGANACYTLGWITELLWSGGETTRTEAFRPTIYGRGPRLSMAVAAAPGVLVPLMWLVVGFH